MLAGYVTQPILKDRAEQKTSWVSTNPTIVWINEEFEQYSLHESTDVFEFKPLKKLEKCFLKSGEYAPREVNELIRGLSRLPGYAAKPKSKGRGTTRSRT